MCRLQSRGSSSGPIRPEFLALIGEILGEGAGDRQLLTEKFGRSGGFSLKKIGHRFT